MKFVMALRIRKISICVPFRLFELIDTGSCIDKGDLIFNYWYTGPNFSN